MPYEREFLVVARLKHIAKLDAVRCHPARGVVDQISHLPGERRYGKQTAHVCKQFRITEEGWAHAPSVAPAVGSVQVVA